MFTETIHGKQLSFETEGAVFSPQRADKGTLAMLDVLRNILRPDEKILDLGCGYGVVGIYAAKMAGDQNIIMSDIEPVCVELSKKNAELNGVGGVKVILSDGFMDIRDVDFTIILSNPPYQADFSVPKHFIEKGFNRLQIGGRMLMVTKRKLWYKNKLTAIFGGVMIYEAGGYHVFYAEKRSSKYANK
jgi:16S rRNA (guanine1207-N2)-methyltransferase